MIWGWTHDDRIISGLFKCWIVQRTFHVMKRVPGLMESLRTPSGLLSGAVEDKSWFSAKMF